jgi:3-dehydroquinate synthase
MITVHLKERSYQIIAGSGVLASLGRRCAAADLGSDAFCVTDPFVKARYGKIISSSLSRAGLASTFFVAPSGEKSKSFDECRCLLEALARFDKNKRVFVVAAGGGVVGDLAGFCAAVYKRGVAYVQVPTTLLAQVDSSIGGKTAIDLKHGKNLVGAFFQPKLVLSDVSLLASLNRRQFASGMAETVKYGVISDPRLFGLLERKAGTLQSGASRELVPIIAACSRIKAGIVEKDERDETGKRIILNFGHTLGHALEAAHGYGGYTHGEAVAIGMACACDLSRRLGLLDAESAGRIERLLTSFGLPVKMRPVAFRAIAEPYLRDKKFKGKSRFVLLSKIGSPRVVEDVPLSLVREVVASRMV